MCVYPLIHIVYKKFIAISPEIVYNYRQKF